MRPSIDQQIAESMSSLSHYVEERNKTANCLNVSEENNKNREDIHEISRVIGKAPINPMTFHVDNIMMSNMNKMGVVTQDPRIKEVALMKYTQGQMLECPGTRSRSS